MFLVFDWGTDPETHSGMELYCPVPVQHESGCFGVLRRWRSTYKTVNHQSHLVRHYLPTAAQLWFKIYTRLTNSSTATPGSCTTKVSIMPGLLLFFFFFLGFGDQTSIFIWGFHVSYSFLISPVLLPSQTWLCWTDGPLAVRGVTGRLSWCLLLILHTLSSHACINTVTQTYFYSSSTICCFNTFALT